MVDPLDPQHVERLGHVLRPALLAGVRHPVQPLRGGQPVRAGEQPRRPADLGGVEAHADEVLAERQRLAQQVLGGLAAEVAQEAHDQVGGEVRVPCLREGRPEPLEDRRQRNAVGHVRLRVAEHLGPSDAGCPGAGQVGGGEVVEVLGGPEHRQVGVVDVEEVLQAAEVGVARRQLRRVVRRQRDVVAAGQLDQQVGLEGALDVDVQLGQGQRHPVIMAHGHGLALSRRSAPSAP